jgi:hypothetical protein
MDYFQKSKLENKKDSSHVKLRIIQKVFIDSFYLFYLKYELNICGFYILFPGSIYFLFVCSLIIIIVTWSDSTDLPDT